MELEERAGVHDDARANRPDGKQQRLSLGILYAASGLGAASAVPESAGTMYVIGKRIRQHAVVLRGLMAHLDESNAAALFDQCARQPNTLPGAL